MTKIKCIVLDVDGTLTDGKVYLISGGNEIKVFDTLDGLILTVIVKIGIKIIIITGRKSDIVNRRMTELGVTEIFQNISNKKELLTNYLNDNKIDSKDVCYIGDDLSDLSAMKICGFSACPANAVEEVKKAVDYVAKKKGGEGAVREIIEHILKLNGKWEQVLGLFE